MQLKALVSANETSINELLKSFVAEKYEELSIRKMREGADQYDSLFEN